MKGTIRNEEVVLETNFGQILIGLFEEYPRTTENFLKLVNEGFYNDTIFHRVISGFMIQGGDPTGTGKGGPGYTINDEFTDHNSNDRGTIAMANSGPDTGGSQFFINLKDNHHLDDKHPVFGEVLKGMDVVEQIAQVETNQEDKPRQEVKLEETYIVEE